MLTNGNVNRNSYTIKEVLDKGILMLKKSNNEAPVIDAGALLCNILKKDKAYIYAFGEQEISTEQSEVFFQNIEKRISGIPLQYLTGHQEFMSLDFLVSEDVLIPRQDTEILVEKAIELAKMKSNDQIRILDIGTGSGCIAISLAYYIPNSLIYALDVSGKALMVAKNNAEKNGVSSKIVFIESDIHNLDTKDTCFEDGFDIVVSNPPYIPTEEIKTLQIEVRGYEPMSALDGGEDGLDFYKSIVDLGKEILKPSGLLMFEVGYNQADDVERLMKEKYTDIQKVKDLSGIDRVVFGKR